MGGGVITCLPFNWCSSTKLQSCIQAVDLICTGRHGINTFLLHTPPTSPPPMFAHAWVYSTVSLSLLCHRVMSDSCSTFPPCLSAVTCLSSSVTIFSLLLPCLLAASGLTVHPPKHTHTRTFTQFALLSWGCLSPV